MSSAKMSDEDLEVRPRGQTNHLIQMEEKRPLDQYFSWYKFKRAVAWLLRFVESIKGRRCLRVSSPVDVSSCGRLSIGELRYAEAQIIKYVRKSAFLPVIKALQDVNHGEPEKITLNNIGSFGAV